MASCASCDGPLVLDFDREEQEDEVVPDDLQLPCGCHFHWQCLFDEAAEVAVSLKCPSCQTYLPSNQPGPSITNPVFRTPQGGAAILTRYHNEGGLQDDYDILPDITEEAYLLAHPEARRARAFLIMCAEGDVVGILSLIAGGGGGGGGDGDEDEDEDEDEGVGGGGALLGTPELLRYQDPLNGAKSGLHIAVEKNQEEVFYLLLFLASRLPTGAFPANVLQSAEQVGLGRPEQVAADPDIRGLRDERGETAEDYAVRAGGVWASLAEAGIFTHS